jgi:hypothetical protein
MVATGVGTLRSLVARTNKCGECIRLKYKPHVSAIVIVTYDFVSKSYFKQNMLNIVSNCYTTCMTTPLVPLLRVRALHWVPIPIPMGFGWAWVRCYCSWVGMGGHRSLLMVMGWVWVQIRRKMLGFAKG